VCCIDRLSSRFKEFLRNLLYLSFLPLRSQPSLPPAQLGEIPFKFQLTIEN
jgi:hypothetical protein